MRYSILPAALLAFTASGCAANTLAAASAGAVTATSLAKAAGASCAAPNICLEVMLSGQSAYSPTGSAATGRAFVAINLETQTVSLSAEIDGISAGDLSDSLVGAPIGPVHIHQYASDDVSALALTFPFGAQYQDKPGGFSLVAKDTNFAERSKIIDPAMTFDAFVAAANAGKLVLNIHTDKFMAGEISGVLVLRPKA